MGNVRRDELAAKLYSFDRQKDAPEFGRLNDAEKAPYYAKADGLISSGFVITEEAKQP